MYVFIIVFISVFVIITLLRMYVNRNWELIYTAFGHELYSRIREKLDRKGIQIKTVLPNHGDRGKITEHLTQYDIYVKKTEKNLAAEALQKE
ncbi:MAG: hypothetical protein H0Z32_15025 [Bacillaceae bacterium]|nr:hypothetical protein [Bacillaceae bacterium]